MPDIICLVDTRLKAEVYDEIRNDYNVQCFFNFSERAARGVCILVKNTLPIKVDKIEKDTNAKKVQS